QFRGKTLIQNGIDSARQAGMQPIILVLGSNSQVILNESDTAGVIVVENETWQTGMASSVIAGINALENSFPLTEAVILMVCDQPYVDELLLRKLICKHQDSRKPIVASKYANILGVPVLFRRSLFKELMDLEGDSGARKIIQQYADAVEAVPFPEGSIDIDTTDDYERLKQ
ncbi:MAG: nucleotidyltransferase family protein, partial [Mucilaginibacter sp.]